MLEIKWPKGTMQLFEVPEEAKPAYRKAISEAAQKWSDGIDQRAMEQVLKELKDK